MITTWQISFWHLLSLFCTTPTLDPTGFRTWNPVDPDRPTDWRHV